MSSPRRSNADPRTGAVASTRVPAPAADATRAASASPERAGPPPQLHSDALFGNSDVVLIQHAGETYRLQRTRLGKLILTK